MNARGTEKMEKDEEMNDVAKRKKKRVHFAQAIEELSKQKKKLL